jgi:hypothetical protein
LRRFRVAGARSQWGAARWLASAVFSVILGLAPGVRAEPLPPAGSAPARYSAYEAQSIADALADLRSEEDAAPAGKSIEHVEVVTLDVLEKRDPLPRFLNVFHATTRQQIVRRELLFRPGDRYDQRRIDESARNLRDIRQLSLVLIVPYRGSAPNRVRVLVVTKDIWSLRLNSNFGYDNGVLTSLLLAPSEENLFGTHASLGALFVLRPATYSLGGVFSYGRLFGSRVETRLNANVIVNRETGAAEGGTGYAYYGQPLYSLATEWAWKSVLVWENQVTRRFRRGTQRVFDARPAAERAAPCEGRCIPYEFGTDYLFGAYEVTRSFGREAKYDVSVGIEAERGTYDVDTLREYAAAAVREFSRREVPPDDQRISPYAQLHARSTKFLRTINLETLGLQEDYQLGHDIWLRVYPASRSVGSTRDLLGTFAALGYTAAFGGGLMRAYGSHTLEYGGTNRSDGTLEFGTYIATPRLPIGRLVHDLWLFHKYRDYSHDRFALGGETRPRGFASGEFLGKDAVATTLEFRSVPVEILSAQVGAAAFYDVADAFQGFSALRLHHSAGVGLRALIPWLDRTVFRVDWGVPLDDGAALPGAVFITFRQAFAVPKIRPSSPASFFGLERQ